MRIRAIRARTLHAIEAMTDNIVGYVINLGLVLVVYNAILGYDITIEHNAAGGAIIFVAAFVRKYAIRRGFNLIVKRAYDGRDPR